MAAAVTFGEAMLRFSPPGHRRLEQMQQLEVWPAGAELNVAVGLARLGTPAAWISRLPRNPLGRLVASLAQAQGVDTSNVVWVDDARLGLYFVEVAAPPRQSSAFYDRAGSAFASLRADEFDWPALLADARLFHTTGITCAVPPACADAAERALAAAHTAGCLTSFDVNFRGRLTTPAAACEAVERVAGSLDVLLTSANDAATVFGIEGEALDV